MRRREFIGAVAGGLIASSCSSVGLGADKIRRIGYLAAGDPTVPVIKGLTDAFFQQLQSYGWHDGRNLEIVQRWAKGRTELLPGLAAELVKLDIDVLVGVTGWGAAVSHQATKSIPVVAIAVHDGVGMGLYRSLATPEGNVTGVESLSETINAKRIEMMKEIVPGLSRLGVLLNPQYPGGAAHLERAKKVAEQIGATVMAVEVKTPADIETAVAAIRNDRPDALLSILDPVVTLVSPRIIELALQERIPTFGEWSDLVGLGQLLSYGPTLESMWRRGAYYVDRILRGALPRDLPVEQPTRLELAINLKTAKAIGAEIPAALLARADRVFE